MNKYLVMFDLIQVNTSKRFGAIVVATSIYDAVETLKHCSYSGNPIPLYSVNPVLRGKRPVVAELVMDK